MSDKETMALEEFIEELRDDVNRFFRFWRDEQRGENGEHYPENMPPGEWGEQWIAFMEAKGE